MNRVIPVPLSTSERLPHIGGKSIFPCLVNSFARFKLGELLKSINAEAKLQRGGGSGGLRDARKTLIYT